MKTHDSLKRIITIGVLTACVLSGIVIAQTPADSGDGIKGTTGLTNNGDFRVSYTTSERPLAINRIHFWTLRVETPDGIPVKDARIHVVGGMPEHDHGMPTSPRVVHSPADGEYLVGGMKFHMQGRWAVGFVIIADGKRDTILFELTL